MNIKGIFFLQEGLTIDIVVKSREELNLKSKLLLKSIQLFGVLLKLEILGVTAKLVPTIIVLSVIQIWLELRNKKLGKINCLYDNFFAHTTY